MCQSRPRKIMVENLAIIHSAPRRHVRSLLTKPKSMAEAPAAKDEIIARARNFEPRAFDHLPSQTSSDDDLEIPAPNQAVSRAVNRDDFSPASGVAFSDGNRSYPRPGVRAFVALQGLCELKGRNLLRPAAMRHSRAEIVTHTSKIGRSRRAPQRFDVCGYSAACRVKVSVNYAARPSCPPCPA